MNSDGTPDPFTVERDGSQVWAAMSHEIRTPLMGVVGMLEVLSRTSLTDEQRRIIATAEESSVALMRIVDDVLDFAKLETSRAKFEPTTTDSGALLESACDLLANAAAAKGLLLTSEVSPEVPAVMCDPLRVRQILLNLGMNAIKFTDRGQVSLTARVLECSATHCLVRFAVSDSGIGIPTDLHAFLFKPFSQLATTNSTGFGGVGLGLAICRNLVTHMGGKIEIESGDGRGTRFNVDLPLPRAAPSAVTVPTHRLEDRSVIMVDAGEPALQIAARYLEAAGASITRIRSLSALRKDATSSSAKGRLTILVGPDAEPEDLEATTAALKSSGAGVHAPILWLHPSAIGGTVALARRGVRAIRAYPMRRAELLNFVAEARPVSDEEPAPYLMRSPTPTPETLGNEEAVMAARAEGRVILVVEDNPVNQEVIRQQLAILGYGCDIAASGQAALRLLPKSRYLLILCDCHMPGMDGFELTGIIRAGERSGAPHLPIIAITANALPGEAARCKAAGMDDYLAKPIEIRALQSMIEGWIRPGRRTERAASRVDVIVSATEARPDTFSDMETVDLRNLIAVYAGNRTQLGNVLDQWLGVMNATAVELAAALEAGQWDKALAAVHRIKGSAGIAGANDLSVASTVLESALNARDPARIEENGERVQNLVSKAFQEIVAWKARRDDTASHAALSLAASERTT